MISASRQIILPELIRCSFIVKFNFIRLSNYSQDATASFEEFQKPLERIQAEVVLPKRMKNLNFPPIFILAPTSGTEFVIPPPFGGGEGNQSTGGNDFQKAETGTKPRLSAIKRTAPQYSPSSSVPCFIYSNFIYGVVLPGKLFPLLLAARRRCGVVVPGYIDGRRQQTAIGRIPFQPCHLQANSHQFRCLCLCLLPSDTHVKL